MPHRIFTALFVVAIAGCNAASPTELADFTVGSIGGDWLFAFSGASCAPADIQVSFSQFQTGGALPLEIGLVGSWQTVGQPEAFDLDGTLNRDTGKVIIELIAGVRIMDGIFLTNDYVAMAYTDLASGCRARASGRRAE